MTNTVDKFNKQDKTHRFIFIYMKTQEWVQRCTKQLTFWSNIFSKPMVSAECPLGRLQAIAKNRLLAYFEESQARNGWENGSAKQHASLLGSNYQIPLWSYQLLWTPWSTMKYLFLWYSLRNWTPCNQRIGIKKWILIWKSDLQWEA